MTIAIVWFRQDLRLADNPAFIEACNQHQVVIPLYIYDKASSTLGAAQAWWLHHSLIAHTKSLKKMGLDLVLRKGKPLHILNELVEQHAVSAVYWNRCYEPLAISRDKEIKTVLMQKGLAVNSFNGSILNEPWTIKNKNNEYYKVFGAYWKVCLQRINAPELQTITKRPKSIAIIGDALDTWKLLPKSNWAQEFSDYWQPGEEGALQKLDVFISQHLNDYQTERDVPAKNATSRLSPHLHFGELSPWTVWRAVELAHLNAQCTLATAEKFLSELGWREFSMYLLYHFPSLPQDNFRKEFNSFTWNNEDAHLQRWQKGMTGYPLVDAGMRELWATGYMHNRLRMVVASFLTKDLLIDWRIGADWFLDTLLDADLANNSASWQWVAGCGADAAPYFRIFNPVLQSQKFDPAGIYIRQWIPELAHLPNKLIHQPWTAGGLQYPKPIVDHSYARARALKLYKSIKK